MIIKENTILYFSGTGNSLQAAKDIKRELGDMKLCKMASLIAENEINIKSELLGIVFPVYYARLPLIVEKFLKKLRISKDTYVFAIATHGGGPAEVLVKLNKLLRAKESALHSGFLLRMPANHIFKYNPSSLESANQVFANEKARIREIASVIQERQPHNYDVSKLLIDTFIDKLFMKTTDRIMDNLHIKDNGFWTTDNCNGCKLCEKICPVHNIEFNTNKPSWKNKCEQCTSCIQYCPQEALQWGNKTEKRRRYKNPNINVSELL